MECLEREIDNENRDTRFEGRALQGYPWVLVQSMDLWDDFVASCHWWSWTPSWFTSISSFDILTTFLLWSQNWFLLLYQTCGYIIHILFEAYFFKMSWKCICRLYGTCKRLEKNEQMWCELILNSISNCLVLSSNVQPEICMVVSGFCV